MYGFLSKISNLARNRVGSFKVPQSKIFKNIQISRKIQNQFVLNIVQIKTKFHSKEKMIFFESFCYYFGVFVLILISLYLTLWMYRMFIGPAIFGGSIKFQKYGKWARKLKGFFYITTLLF
jgi:hypothetical protein